MSARKISNFVWPVVLIAAAMTGCYAPPPLPPVAPYPTASVPLPRPGDLLPPPPDSGNAVPPAPAPKPPPVVPDPNPGPVAQAPRLPPTPPKPSGEQPECIGWWRICHAFF